MNFNKLLLSTIMLLLAIYGQAQCNETPKYLDTSLDFETRAENLVQQMTLDEKISQLGSTAPAIPRLNIQQYGWGNEALHGVARAGVATVFPQAIGMAASFDVDMMKEVADVISDEARAKHHESARKNDFRGMRGLTFWSPNINIFRDPRWGRGHETYGEDPYLTGQIGMQFVRGLQGDDSKYLKLVATPKHFAAHNGPEIGRRSFNSMTNMRDLWETYLPAFKNLVVDAKAYSVMGAYNSLDGVPCVANQFLLEDILRNKWGFEGYVVSDCHAIRDIYKFHKVVSTPEAAAAIGVRKGCDLNCGPVYQAALKKAVELGFIDEGEIDISIYRLMLARMKLGMFDPAEDVSYAQIPFEINNRKSHDETALKMAQKSMTLLKNNGILPLDKKKIKKIAVVGPNADNVKALYANYHGDASNPITPIDGIRNAVGDDIEITYSKGISLEMAAIGFDQTIIDSRYLFTFDKNGEKVNGLTGHYYNNMELEGKPVFTHIDSQIDFDWGKGSPTKTYVDQGLLEEKEGVNKDSISVRWTGKLLAPMTGKYTIGLVSNDGCRLWIDGKKVADGWSNHTARPYYKCVSFEKGKTYDIKIEYYESYGKSQVHLVWELPGSEVEEGSCPSVLSEKILTDVKNADVAIFIGGLDPDIETENRDRNRIELHEVQIYAIQEMLKTGTPVIFVLMGGSAISFEGLDKEVEALLMSWYPGQRGGDAIAEVLFGDYNPAGRLPVTFYSSTDELASLSDYNMRAGKGFTYRHYTGDALYPFGHGLSYSSYKYSDLKIDKTTLTNTDEITVSAKVKNDGKVDGEEVVQLYIKDVKSDKWMAIKQLRGFERIALEKGKSKTIEFKLNVSEDMRYYDSKHRSYMVEPGDFEIQIGASSDDIRLKGVVTVK